MSHQPLLQVDNLCVHFHSREGVVRAVDGVSFTIKDGEILGIVGESGSGKSVACYSLLGLVPSPPGQIAGGRALFEGHDLLKMSDSQLRAIRGQKIGMVFQDPMTSLNPFMSIGAQLMEPLLVHQKMRSSAAKSRVLSALEEVGIADAHKRFNAFPHEFSGGMRQRVMIAMALINRPKLLIADEPTTALDVTVQAQILALLKQLQQDHQLAVLFISHDLGVVSQMADKVVVMQQGKVVEAAAAGPIFVAPQHPYTQKLIQALPNSAKPVSPQFMETDPSCLVVSNLSKTFRHNTGFIFRKTYKVEALKNVSLTLRKGEILGLVGESGSGKSTLGRSILQLLRQDSGQVTLDGQVLTALSESELRRQRRNFQMIFQDPYASLNPRKTVFETLTEPMLQHQLVARNDVLKAVNQLMDDVGLDRAMIRKYPHEFSGGQRQRIAIARALAVQPKLIIADEPVSALDVTIQAQILALLLQLTQKYRLSMLFISHDLAVVRYISDRVAVMKQGEIVEIGETESVFSAPKHSYTQSLLAAIPHLNCGAISSKP